MKHYLVDTNIILDLLADRGEYAVHAAYLFDAAEKGNVSPDTYFNVVHRQKTVIYAGA
jgi:hypothetical protein